MFFIAGGTGFIGSHLVTSLGEKGLQGRCLIRSLKSSGSTAICKNAGFDTVVGDITNRESLKGKLDSCEIVVHLVGIIDEDQGISFEKVHVEGTDNLVNEAQRAKVRHFFYLSSLGASTSSWSRYLKTKAEAENIVRESGIPHTIFRPCIVVGKGDGFTAKLKDLISYSPVVPLPGEGKTKFQPIFVEDLIKCFIKLFSTQLPVAHPVSPVYELGGPEQLTYNEILFQLMEAMGSSKPVIHIPLEMVKLGLPLSKISRSVGSLFGKKIPSITGEQLRLLEIDNICDTDSVEKQFGFIPIRYKEALRLFVKK
ncbi:MAG: complex I NDUFA9 subunit family protein [Nitrospirae bacterium]|nr:complex I NDUFA9 subunit family protein [Nitrospirota bacterium]